MASNDMNSWDEDPDELLRQRWQQTFADFKVRANPALSSRILGSLPNYRRRSRTYRMVGLVLLVSVGLLYPFKLGERPNLERSNVIMVLHSTPIQQLSAQAIPLSEPPSSRVLPPSLLVIDSRPDEPVANRQPRVNPLPGTGVVVPSSEVSSGNRIIPKPLFRDQAGPGPRVDLRSRITSVPANESPDKSVRSVTTHLPTESGKPATKGGYEPMLVPMGQSVSHTIDAISTKSPFGQPLANALPVLWERLNPSGSRLLSTSLSTLPGHLLIIDAVPSHPVEVIESHRRRHWFAEVVPLTSFQRMSIPSAATAYLSHVRAPGDFSPVTWGYQVNGGIRWQHWQAHLSLGQVRRWAYYTVNENRYRVEPIPDNPNQVVQETHTVTENVLLPIIGLGLSQETLLDRGRYAVEIGGQVSYLPTSRQALIGLRGGVGRRLAMSRIGELQVGLKVEYGLNRLLNEQQQLVIHPLLVGIGIRIQPPKR